MKRASRRWIEDRRGRRVRLLDPMTLQLLHRTDAIDRETLDRILNELEPGLARRMKWLLIPPVLALAAMALFYGALWAIGASTLRASLTRALTPNPGIYLTILFTAVIAPLMAARKLRARAPAIMLRHLLCPHCAYDLHGLPEDEADGATVCPECSCAWDLHAVTGRGSP